MTFLTKPRKPLKRSPFKSRNTSIKPKTALKHTKLSKYGKSSVSKLKRRLWTEFSLFIRNRDKGICFSCGRKVEGKGYHAGHFIAKSIGGLALYFNENNVHGQCYHCNINLGGNQWEYGQRLGKEKVEELMKLKQVFTKWSEQDYLDKIKYYGNKNL
jgi:hypothetical protein